MKTFLLPVAALSLGLATSCTTMYDSYGRPTEVVTPEGVAIAALAAGVIGYAIGDNQRSSKRHYGRGGYSGHGGYSGRGHGGGGYGSGAYCR